MCIICNVPHENLHAATDFLGAVESARRGMRDAEKALLKVAEVAIDEGDRRRYRAIHKQMVRLRRQWNELEENREIQPVAAP